MTIFLNNIRSIFNVGAIFRTVDSVGTDELILGGYTPHPPMDKLHKTALGAVDYVHWSHLENQNVMDFLQENKGKKRIISVEQDSRSICYTDKIAQDSMTWENTIYVFGNEIVGVDKDILDISDLIIDLPMYGKKNSLNVSVTVGIICYEARKLRTIQSKA